MRELVTARHGRADYAGLRRLCAHAASYRKVIAISRFIVMSQFFPYGKPGFAAYLHVFYRKIYNDAH